LSKTPGLFDLTGRVAVVTGGDRGIGRSIAIGLAEAGAAVAIAARNQEKNQQTLAELKAIGVPCMAVKLDVTDRPALEPALQQVERQLGPIGILVNNAGIASLSGGVLNEKAEDWDRVIETQLTAVFLLSKLAARSMLSQGSGKIINVGSMYSYFGSGLVPSYSAAKGAIMQLTKSMAIEFAPHNIQVNAIAPGWIETDLTVAVRSMPMNEEILARTPAGRWGKPDEMIGTAVFLASRASDFVTGTPSPSTAAMPSGEAAGFERTRASRHPRHEASETRYRLAQPFTAGCRRSSR
jgi:2-deoxy-D-gluconate 3-dehydrogenase